MLIEKYSWKKFVADYWILLKGRRFRFVYYSTMRGVANLLHFVETFLLGMVVDFFVDYNQGDSLMPFYYLVIGIGAIGLFLLWLRFYGKIRMQTIAAELRKETRMKAMSNMLRLGLKWHEKEDSGTKLQRINKGGESIYYGIFKFSNEGLTILAALVGSFVAFLLLDWKYSLFVLIFGLIFIHIILRFNKRISYWEERQNNIQERISGKLHESTSNLLTIKSLGLKKEFEEKSGKYEKQYFEIWKKKRRATELKTKVTKAFAAITFALFVLLVGLDVVKGNLTVGLILVFTSYFGKCKRALFDTSNHLREMIAIRSAVGRFMTIYGKIIKEDKGEAIKRNWRKIIVKNLSFRYRKELTLKDLNLTIKRNEKVGIVGKSGCGKSTLTKLLLRLYEPHQGKIMIDDKNLNEYSQESITQTISTVPQDSEMFNLSLLENVTVVSAKKDFDKFKKAVKIAQLDKLVNQLPKGLNTLLGEKGYKLSGGERQRVGLARAIYKDSSLLILDEATSHLDSKTEDLIQKSLEKELKDKTLLIIAHRLSTLKNVDRIIVMSKGRIVEEGTFEELIKKKSKFWELYQLQRNK